MNNTISINLLKITDLTLKITKSLCPKGKQPVRICTDIKCSKTENRIMCGFKNC